MKQGEIWRARGLERLVSKLQRSDIRGAIGADQFWKDGIASEQSA